MINGIGRFFVKTDNVCDYIPVVSTVSVLTDLLIRGVVFPFMNKDTINNNCYFTHLKDKSVARSIPLLIPVIGNLIVCIYDFKSRKHNDRDESLVEVVVEDAVEVDDVKSHDINDIYQFDDLTDEDKKDKQKMLKYLEKNPRDLKYAKNFQDDKDVVFAAVINNPFAFEYASECLKNDFNFIQRLLKHNTEKMPHFLLKYASKEIKNNKGQMLSILENHPAAYRFVGESIKNDADIVKCKSKF